MSWQGGDYVKNNSSYVLKEFFPSILSINIKKKIYIAFVSLTSGHPTYLEIFLSGQRTANSISY